MTSVHPTNVTLQNAFCLKQESSTKMESCFFPDVLDYIHITQNGLKPEQGHFKERSEFLETLPFITRYTTSDKDEL